MNGFSILIYVVVLLLIVWIWGAVKAAKDPDVKEASYLRMTVKRYKIYKELWGEIQSVYKQNGTTSEDSYNKVTEILKKVPNMNEWRAFGKRQEELSKKEFQDMLNDLKNGKI